MGEDLSGDHEQMHQTAVRTFSDEPESDSVELQGSAVERVLRCERLLDLIEQIRNRKGRWQ